MTARPGVIILAGGRGERLWPLVRASQPKACVRPDGRHSLLELTIRRLGAFARPADAWIITTAGQDGSIRRAVPAAWKSRVLAEPEPKNTAACITLGAAIVAGDDPSRLMVVVPADHWIEPAGAWHRALRAAMALTRQDPTRLAVIGVRARRVHPGLGHLMPGAACAPGAFRLKRCVEKPSPASARQLMQAGARWNAGVFVGQAQAFMRAITRWLPRHAARLMPLGRLAGTTHFTRAAQAAYRGLADVSFDHGVMAHLADGYLVEGRFAFEDLGSWDSWGRLASAQPPLMIGGRNVRTINANGHVVVSVGLKDVMVVHTPDATLLCHTTQAQSVRQIAQRLVRDPRWARLR